ncbi:MAG: sigma-54 dependent transcriptional regulator [candidate division WOR-3 bacterium]|nr:sigma-54 dependent transcriptional regulator [candidate division WOR-3 bacterium]
MSIILIADDEKVVVDGLALVLKEYQPELATTKDQAIKILKEYTIDLLLCDLFFPNLEDGLSLIKTTKEISPETFIVAFTAHGSIETAVQAVKSGADDFLTKGISTEELKIKIANFLKIAQERKQLEQFKGFTRVLSETSPGFELIGNTPVMQKIKDRIKTAGKEGKVNVLITGETGTGKEVCAKMIHSLSPRNQFPFLPLDCPSIPENLFESELFGYEKGAFTDAKQRKIGKLELAHKGTLFLDEIADLPLNLQPKLLRFLETGEFFRLGGTRPINVDTRIVASTNQDLEELVKAKKFREDLFYRLKVFVIELPPLRERKEDIPILVDFFFKTLDPLGKKFHKISSRLMAALIDYHWPGNIRELRNMIECYLITESENEILKMLTRTKSGGQISSASNAGKEFAFVQSTNYKQARKSIIQKFEKDFILQILQQEDWNITRTAQKIGISREELHRKIKRLGIKKI